jgi:hypothetical protein
MFMQKVLVRAVAGIKRCMTPPEGSRPRRIFNGAARAYWPVLLGGSVAIVLVGAGLTVAVQSVKRPIPQWAQVPSQATPRLIIEEPIVPGTARPEAPPFALSAKAPLPGPIPSPKFQDLAMILQPPAPEIQVDNNPQDTTCDTYGTSVNFMRSPTAAARKAGKEDKLLFTLHVSGNFEDPQFT